MMKAVVFVAAMAAVQVSAASPSACFGYVQAAGSDWSELRVRMQPSGKHQLSTHIPVGLPEASAVVYADPSFNAWMLPVPADLKTGDKASAARIAAVTSTLFTVALGDAPFVPDFRQTVWTRRRGGYPIVRGELEATYTRYTFEYCTHPGNGELYVRGTVLNTGNVPRKGVVRLRRAAVGETEGLDYHYIGYDWTAEKASRGVTLAPPACVETDFPAPIVEKSWSVGDDAYDRGPGFWGSPYYVQPRMRLKTGGGTLTFAAELQPGESRSFTVSAGFAAEPTRHPPFAETCRAAERFWDGHDVVSADFGAARENDLFRSLQFSNLQLLINPSGRLPDDRLQPCQGGTSERFFVWVWEAMASLRPMIRLGHAAEVRKVLEFVLALQDGGCPPKGDFTTLAGAIGTTGPRWANTTGAALLLAADYLDLSGDEDFARRHVAGLVRAADWILGETAATRRYGSDGRKKFGYGLMPGCVANDGDTGVFFATTDSWSAAGVKFLAAALARRGHPDAERLREGFERYRTDISAAIASVQRPDGFIPRRLGTDGNPSFEFRNIPAALNFLAAEVYDPRENPPALAMLRYWERTHARGGFLRPFDARIMYIGNSESDVARVHAQLGEWKRAALARATFFNYALTRDLGITAERYSEVDDAFAPWQPNASNNGRALGLLLDRFLLEGDSVIVLTGGFAPYEDGDVSVSGLRTRHGRFSLRRVSGRLEAAWERPLPAGTRLAVPAYAGFVPDGGNLKRVGEGEWVLAAPTDRVSGSLKKSP